MNFIVTETELLTDLRFYQYLTKNDLAGNTPIVINLLADGLPETSKKWLNRAMAAGLLRLVELELEDVLNVPQALYNAGLSIGEACSLWYAAKHGMTAIGCSGYWQKLKFIGVKVISQKEPAKLFGEMQRLHLTKGVAKDTFSSRKTKQGR